MVSLQGHRAADRCPSRANIFLRKLEIKEQLLPAPLLSHLYWYSWHLSILTQELRVSSFLGWRELLWKILGCTGSLLLLHQHAACPHCLPEGESAKACNNTHWCLPGRGLSVCLDVGGGLMFQMCDLHVGSTLHRGTASPCLLNTLTMCYSIWSKAIHNKCWRGSLLWFCGSWGQCAGSHITCFWGTYILSKPKETICFDFVFLQRKDPLCRCTQTHSPSHPYLFLALSHMKSWSPLCQVDLFILLSHQTRNV